VVNFRKASDEELVIEIRRGRREAFVELVERYRNQLFQLAYRMLGDYGLAEDVAQETFLRVYESLAGFKVHRKFSAWIYRIATNLCIDLLRKQGRIRIQSTDQPVPGTEDFYPEIPSPRPPTEAVALRRQLQAQLQRLIASLPPKYRAVIVLRYVQDLAYQEIAEILELPLGTVKTRLFRAREALRARLEGDAALCSLVNEILEDEVLPMPELEREEAAPRQGRTAPPSARQQPAADAGVNPETVGEGSQ